jgi:hypothetical protein
MKFSNGKVDMIGFARKALLFSFCSFISIGVSASDGVLLQCSGKEKTKNLDR